MMGDKNEQLIVAVESGDLALCQSLLDDGADINAKASGTKSVLYLAANKGYVDVCEALLARGAYLGVDSLLVASAGGWLDVCKLFKWWDEGLFEDFGHRVLHMAAIKNQVDVCRFCLDSGVAVDARDVNGQAPLHSAAGSAAYEVCRLLLERGAEVDALNDSKVTPLYMAMMCDFAGLGDSLGCCDVLVEFGAKTAAICGRTTESIFHVAVSNNKLRAVRVLSRAADVDLSQRSATGKTVMQLAHSKEMRELLRAIKAEDAVRRGVEGGLGGDGRRDGAPAPARKNSLGML